MNVLLVINEVTPGNLPGLQFQVEGLADRDIQAQVLTLEVDDDLNADIDIIECPGGHHAWRSGWETRRLQWDPGKLPDVLHLLEPDVAELGLALADHLGRPYVLSVDEFIPPGQRLRLSRRWFRSILTSNRDLAGDLVAGMELPRGRIEVIPPGSAPIDDRATVPVRPRGPVGIIGFGAGQVDPSGILTCFQAARLLLDRGADCEFVVAGADDDEPETRRLAAMLRLAERITFADPWVLGHAFWSVFDVYCRASTVAALGPEVGDAMRHGIPVVVSDVPGLRTWMEAPETGLLVPRGDPEALASALAFLLDHPDQARRLGDNARDWADRHCDPEAHLDHLADIYARIHRDDLADRAEAAAEEADGK